MENRSLLIGRFQRSEIKVKSEKSEVGGGISLNHRDPEKNGDTEKRGGMENLDLVISAVSNDQ